MEIKLYDRDIEHIANNERQGGAVIPLSKSVLQEKWSN